MTTLEKFGDMADGFQDQMNHQLEQLSRWAKPYARRLNRFSDDMRPYGRQAVDYARKNPGKTAVGALLFGYLLARFTRR
jgi:hypothetical protein